MHIERYQFIRKELTRLYEILALRTYLVTMPMSSFMTLRQLNNTKKNPPMQGFESVIAPVERPFTIDFILGAVKIMGDDISLGFRHAREDIPVIYDAIQEWIRYWIEIKTNASYFRTPDIKELELLERLARFLFTPYAHYHHEKINNVMNIRPEKEMTLLDVLAGRMMFGDGFDEPISYISHLDHYKSSIGYTDYSGGNESSLDFLRGVGFGGGM